ncbi:hypothetical protein DMB66_43445 [Actinoplanes sp. ATCC 53533]|uniref:hypothetical protein n=1 Tax=Actinoplanes sp. ATCC 53533 TaxID=1288362 RepID=UPI000F77D497|nr:hypothetical protein [Actinoplanes sp. ATCC 53533]RSM50487.1 hypothetical protein DMB66_43445 [Actinoplanes sp. ATCC 53533]
MNENDLREAMRASLTITPPPPMESAAAVTAGRRAVRRRTTLAGAGVAAVLVTATALAVNPGLRLVAGGDGGNAPWAGPGVPSAHPTPADAGDHTKPAWPLDGDGQPQEDATARSGERYEQGKKLLDEILAVVPAGWSKPTGETADKIPLRSHQAAVEGDNSGKTWGYLASAAVAKDGGTGRLLAEVHTKDNGLPQEPCELARSFWTMGGDCEIVTVGTARVGVVKSGGSDSGIDQWAAFRHSDGVVVYMAQSRTASNGEANPGSLTNLPLTVPQLAALATDARFHLG